MQQVTFHHVSETGQRVTSYLITATREEWADRPESTSPLWEAYFSGESVLALSVNLGGVTSCGIGATPADSRRN